MDRIAMKPVDIVYKTLVTMWPEPVPKAAKLALRRLSVKHVCNIVVIIIRFERQEM